MLTLVRPSGPSSQRRASVRRCAWNELPEPPRLRLVGVDDGRMGATPEQREVLAIALDRMIDEALRQLTLERSLTRARLATAAAAPTR